MSTCLTYKCNVKLTMTRQQPQTCECHKKSPSQSGGLKAGGLQPSRGACLGPAAAAAAFPVTASAEYAAPRAEAAARS